MEVLDCLCAKEEDKKICKFTHSQHYVTLHHTHCRPTASLAKKLKMWFVIPTIKLGIFVADKER